MKSNERGTDFTGLFLTLTGLFGLIRQAYAKIWQGWIMKKASVLSIFARSPHAKEL
jgi:hypothetical protein